MMKFEATSTALAGYMLSMNTFLSLRQRRVLTYDQANEILEQALLNLETFQSKGDQAAQAAFQEARSMLEFLRQLIADDRY
jgi:hypothetical protein